MGGFNILKTYPELLEILGLSETERYHDLQAIFKRDIEDNSCFAFRNRRIYRLTRQSPWRSLTKTPTIFNGLSFKFATFATWNIKQT